MSPEIIAFSSAADFEAWLAVHGESSPTIGLLLPKKASGKVTLTYAEALDVALCFGWIDGKKTKHDEGAWVQYFSKRKPKSIWSQINREKALRLASEGRMRPAGHAAIEAAKASGQWQAAYQPIKSREIPEELAQALSQRPKAKAFFDSLDSKNRFTFVFRSVNAKKPETRRARIERFIEMMERGETLH